MITEEYVPFHKVIKLLEDFSNRHYDLNAFGFGNLLEYGKDIEDKTLLYPVLFVVPQTITYDEQQTTYSISVIIADRLSDDLHNRVSAISNMSMIAKDLVGEIKLGDLQDYFDTDIPITSTSFIDRMEDSVGGVAMDITLTTLDPINVCDRFLEPVEYNPSQLEGLYAWYDFQDTSTISLSGGTDITQVLDKSGNDYTLTPLVNPPSYSASTYTNSDGYYAMWDRRLNTSLAHNTPTKNWSGGTSFVVYTKPTPSGVKNIAGIVSGATGNTINQSPLGNGVIGEDIITWSTIACREAEGQSLYVPNDFAIVITRVNSNTLGDFDGVEYSKYGVLNADPNDCASKPSDVGNWIVLGDNHYNDGLEVLNGIMEVIYYDRALTDTEYNGVIEYLKNKYRYNYWV